MQDSSFVMSFGSMLYMLWLTATLLTTGAYGLLSPSTWDIRSRKGCAPLFMSLKPAAVPLMDSGKALARSGELLIDVTKALDLYGGGLSAAGAEIRNAGDSVAQAAASARFKTAVELVIDELRESGTCLVAAAEKLGRAVEEAKQDEQMQLAETIGTSTTL
jgi:hypothetical protein